MEPGEVYSCPACGAYVTVTLPNAGLIVCHACSGAVRYVNAVSQTLPVSEVPRDWSFVQVGTTGQYQNDAFTVTGRVRLQLRNDYKNFWSIRHGSKKVLWIMESFGSFSVLQPSWHTYTQAITKLRAGHSITLTGSDTVTGEYVERCEGISYEGQIAAWQFFTPQSLFVVQASREKKTVFFGIQTDSKRAFYMTGEKTTPEELQLGNILQWDEWR